MNQVRLIAVITLWTLLSAGCNHLPALKTESKVSVSLDKPVATKVEASLNSLPDLGPLQEVEIGCPGTHPGGCKIAVVDLDGLLLNVDTVGTYSVGDNPVAAFQEKSNAAAADSAVKAVVLRVNSPGGSVAAIEIMGRSLADFRQ